MKNILIPAVLLCFMNPAAAFSAAVDRQAESIEWSVAHSWKLDVKPLDLAHSLDNKRVFILGDDSRIHIFSAEGTPQGTISVDQGVTAIDIAPRGEMVYLINGKDLTFTSLAITYNMVIDVTGSPFLGNENAPVVLAVFSDFQ
jgi:hypothetical protein